MYYVSTTLEKMLYMYIIILVLYYDEFNECIGI